MYGNFHIHLIFCKTVDSFMCILLQSSYTCLSPVEVLKLYELNLIIHHVDMSLTFVTARYKIGHSEDNHLLVLLPLFLNIGYISSTMRLFTKTDAIGTMTAIFDSQFLTNSTAITVH